MALTDRKSISDYSDSRLHGFLHSGVSKRFDPDIRGGNYERLGRTLYGHEHSSQAATTRDWGWISGVGLQLGSRMNSYWLLRKLEVKYQHMRLTSTRAPRKSVPLLDAVLPNQSLLLHCLYSKNKVGVARWPHKYHMRRCGKVGNRFEFSVQ